MFDFTTTATDWAIWLATAAAVESIMTDRSISLLRPPSPLLPPFPSRAWSPFSLPNRLCSGPPSPPARRVCFVHWNGHYLIAAAASLSSGTLIAVRRSPPSPLFPWLLWTGGSGGGGDGGGGLFPGCPPYPVRTSGVTINVN